MPRYVYECAECDFLFESVHSMTEKLTDCEQCEVKNSLKRLPSSFRLVNKPHSINNTTPAGDVIRDHIKEAKKDIEEAKKEMTKEYEV
tara:strand:+ start:171 stop:434 length:264 start_codon:yes stop_codon:yes gene_type:complete